MRQRNIKNLDERIEANANYLIEDPRACRGHWREIFKNDHPIYLEIGCGKGKFITAHAEREPNCNFIACEGQASVVLRALEKADQLYCIYPPCIKESRYGTDSGYLC